MTVVAESLFTTQPLSVPKEWLDENRHMNVAHYLKAFDNAFYEVHEAWGLRVQDIEQTGKSVFVAECHVSYLAEMVEGDVFTITTQLIGHDKKRMHFYNEMLKEDGTVAATCEWLMLFVDVRHRKVDTMSDEQFDALKGIAIKQSLLPRPSQTGRSISLESRR